MWSIKESPYDDGLRLIFADWLEDNGQRERAELLRLQVGLEQLPIGDLHRVELQKRVNELLAAHKRQWLGPWAGVGRIVHGLIDITCQAERLPELLAAAGGEAALSWVESLSLRGAWEDISAVVGSPWLRHIAKLYLEHNGIGAAGAAALAASPHLARLGLLYLSNNGIGAAGAAALAASPHLAQLSSLDLKHNDIGDAGAAALAASPHLARLSSLGLTGNQIRE